MRSPFFTALLALAVIAHDGISQSTAVQFAVPAEINYMSPVPGAGDVMPGTTIIVRISEKLKKTALSDSVFVVSGSASGLHTGSVLLSDDERTCIFTPDRQFAFGETVTVVVKSGLTTCTRRSVRGTSFSFTITATEIQTRTAAWAKELFVKDLGADGTPNSTAKAGVQKSASTPGLPADFPPITITQSHNPTPGYLFIANFPTQSSPYGDYLILLDNAGVPAYYQRMPTTCLDFKLQPNAMLTFWLLGKYYGMNNSFTIVDSFQCGNGYSTDVHELRVLPNGHSFLLSYDGQSVDMSKIVDGGNPNAWVFGTTLQELDNNKNVVFQWRGWDHFSITDAMPDIDLTASLLDPFHSNAIEIDTDGNILLSSRHMDEITKISREDGHIIWRLGGKHNQFTFINDELGFSHQHAIRRIANGNITLFDNGNFHSPSFSRAVEYQLDERQRTATLVWQYRNTPENYGSAMGYAQRLSNGNMLIGWGACATAVTEVTPSGAIAFEAKFGENGMYSYRAFRFPLIMLRSPNGGEQLRTDSTFVIQWQSSGVSMVNIDFSADAGATWKNIASYVPADSGRYVWTVPTLASDSCLMRIKDALSPDIPDIATSISVFSIHEVPLPVELASFTCEPTAGAVVVKWETATETNNYGFEIERRSMETWMKIGFVDGHGSTNARHSYSFTDNSVSGKIIYRLKQIDRDGNSMYSREVETTVAEPTAFALRQNYPNPFNPTTVIGYTIAAASNVTLTVYDLLGREVALLVNGRREPGTYTAEFSGAGLSTGVYMYRLDAEGRSAVKMLTILR